MSDISVQFMILGLIGAFGLVKLASLVHGCLFSTLKSIPGPFLARLTDVWYLWRLCKGHFETDNLALHREHGKQNRESLIIVAALTPKVL